MDFDNKGRMWVVEMIGYMPNLEGIGEDEPNGRISILEDLDKWSLSYKRPITLPLLKEIIAANKI
jgi:hypothetical protein